MEYIIVNGELRHWGIRGMKWGVRRYQNKDGSLTPAGKKRYNNEVEETPEAKEAKRQQIIKTGSAKEVYGIKDTLSSQEQNTVRQRLQWESDIRRLAESEAASAAAAKGKSKVEKAFDSIGKIKNYAVETAQLYNMGINVANAFRGTNKISLPKIDTDVTKGNKAVRTAEKKLLNAVKKPAEKVEAAVNKVVEKNADKAVSSVPKETVSVGQKAVADYNWRVDGFSRWEK